MRLRSRWSIAGMVWRFPPIIFRAFMREIRESKRKVKFPLASRIRRASVAPSLRAAAPNQPTNQTKPDHEKQHTNHHHRPRTERIPRGILPVRLPVRLEAERIENRSHPRARQIHRGEIPKHPRGSRPDVSDRKETRLVNRSPKNYWSITGGNGH